MLDFYQIVKQNLHYNRFEHENTVCLEYSCPLEADEVGIYSRCDYVVHVLSGKKTFKTFDGAWTLQPGDTLYLKKGAELVRQYFDDDFCMLGFFVTDDLIRETYNEVRGALPLTSDADVASYFGVIAANDRPSIQQIMEKNFCYNLKLEDYADLCCRSLSSFKRDFEQIYHESPGRWLPSNPDSRISPTLAEHSS